MKYPASPVTPEEKAQRAAARALAERHGYEVRSRCGGCIHAAWREGAQCSPDFGVAHQAWGWAAQAAEEVEAIAQMPEALRQFSAALAKTDGARIVHFLAVGSKFVSEPRARPGLRGVLVVDRPDGTKLVSEEVPSETATQLAVIRAAIRAGGGRGVGIGFAESYADSWDAFYFRR